MSDKPFEIEYREGGLQPIGTSLPTGPVHCANCAKAFEFCGDPNPVRLIDLMAAAGEESSIYWFCCADCKIEWFLRRFSAGGSIKRY